MDLDEIKCGLRAEIKKRENEQYFTFQCNVRQMCKDVLAKLEEQESEISELKNEIEKQKQLRDMALASVPNVLKVMKIIQHHKYKRSIAMANWCEERYNYLTCLENWQMTDKEYQQVIGDYWDRWHKRWLKLAEQFKDKEA